MYNEIIIVMVMWQVDFDSFFFRLHISWQVQPKAFFFSFWVILCSITFLYFLKSTPTTSKTIVWTVYWPKHACFWNCGRKPESQGEHVDSFQKGPRPDWDVNRGPSCSSEMTALSTKLPPLKLRYHGEFYVDNQCSALDWSPLLTVTPTDCTHIHTHRVAFVVPDAGRLQWLPLTVSEAVLVAICLSRCIMTASPVGSGQCSLALSDWRRWRGARVKEQGERWCEAAHVEAQKWSLCARKWRGKNVERHNKQKDSSFTRGRGISQSFLPDCGLIWGNWSDIGLSLCSPVKAFRRSLEICDKNTQQSGNVTIHCTLDWDYCL